MNMGRRVLTHVFLGLTTVCLLLPVYLAFVAASHEGSTMMHSPWPILPGPLLWHNLKSVWLYGVMGASGEPIWRLLINSLLMATGVAIGKITFALWTAFVFVYFSLPGKRWLFLLIFSTMMLPVEVRILPTFDVVATFHGINTLWGLTLPLMASATATFLFQQFLKTLSPELLEAAILDGAGPWRFFLI